jgi:hypothetical protein
MDNLNQNPLTTITPTMVPASCAPPLIAYTLALPGQTQVFYHFSGPVYGDITGGSVTSVDFPGSSITPVTTSGNGTSELIATYSTAITTSNIASAAPSMVTVASLYDNSSSPHDYSTDPAWVTRGLPPPHNYYTGTTWPNPLYSTTHRVSDLMISLPPPATGAYNPATYFAWPIYAKDQVALSLSDSQITALTPAQSAAEGIGLIRAFDGSQWLRRQTETIQTRVSSNLPGAQPTIVYDTNVAPTLKGPSGLWLPQHLETDFSGLDAYPNNSAASLNDASGVSGLWDLSVPGTDAKIKGAANGSAFDFFLNLSGAPSNLYVARLDVASGAAIPANWYRLVKPFSFDIHDVNLQKGGGTILNNVIDPTRGETVRLSYQLASSGAVTITVFTLDGDVVARLANVSSQAAGDHSVSWNGRNLGGSPVARGLYFIRIVAPGMDEIRKVLVVRK